MVRTGLNRKLLYLLLVAFVLSGLSTVEAQRRRGKSTRKAPAVVKAPPEIDYTISMSEPWTHLLEVEMRIRWGAMPGKLEVKMPVWTPGSYLVREYARHVQDFVAVGGLSDTLDWRKINKNTWQIDTNGAKEVRIGYRVYSNDLTVRTNELNYEHAFITPPATLLFVKDNLDVPATVEVRPYGDWKVATGMKQIADNTFTAPNFDILYDSPIEVSDFKEKKFTVLGKPHRYVVTGEGNYDLDRIVEDTAKIIEESYKIFGELPYDDYTFILNLRGGGGLEHLNSTALQWNRFRFDEAGYRRFLGLVAHEFFHLYNVKRIRPEPLGPFDYENENYTKLLWVAEGTTSYYEWILMRRAGLVDAADVLKAEASIAESLQKRPGRFQTSLEEASFDAWIKYYRQDENSVNNQISYYSKGELTNFLLDIQIRAGSNGEKSLDDVMRYLYAEHYKKDRTFSSADYQAACELMAGKSLDTFFENYVRGREEFDYDALLKPVGLQMKQLNPENDDAWLGANLNSDTLGLAVSSIPAGTPAHRAGLNAEDVIVALDNHRVSDKKALETLLQGKNAGEKITLAVFRHKMLREIEVTLGKTPASDYRIMPVAEPTEAQSRLFRQYLLEDLAEGVAILP